MDMVAQRIEPTGKQDMRKTIALRAGERKRGYGGDE